MFIGEGGGAEQNFALLPLNKLFAIWKKKEVLSFFFLSYASKRTGGNTASSQSVPTEEKEIVVLNCSTSFGVLPHSEFVLQWNLVPPSDFFLGGGGEGVVFS